MTGRIVIRVVLGLLLIAVVAVAGVYVYNAGVAQGLATNVAAVQPGDGAVAPVLPYAYGYGYGAPFFFHRPFFGWGFGPLGCLFPLLFFLLFFGLLRGLFWGGRWGWGRGGWRHHFEPGERGVPPMFDEWHRRAHGETAEPAEK